MIDPVLSMLVERLPAPDSEWPMAERARWLRAFAASIELIYAPDSAADVDATLLAAADTALSSHEGSGGPSGSLKCSVPTGAGYRPAGGSEEAKAPNPDLGLRQSPGAFIERATSFPEQENRRRGHLQTHHTTTEGLNEVGEQGTAKP